MNKISIIMETAEKAMAAEADRAGQLLGRAEKFAAGIVIVTGFQLWNLTGMLDPSSRWASDSCYLSLAVLSLSLVFAVYCLRLKGYAGYPRGDKLWETLKVGKRIGRRRRTSDHPVALKKPGAERQIKRCQNGSAVLVWRAVRGRIPPRDHQPSAGRSRLCLRQCDVNDMDANRTTSGSGLKVNRPGSVFLRQTGFPTGSSPGQTRFASAFRPAAVRERLTTHLKWSVVVAVIAVWMMQVSVNQVINVIAMRNGSVTAIGTMNVLPVVAFRTERAFVGIRGADGDGVFVHMVAVRMMQMAVVKIIHVPIVHDGDVSAIFAMDMRMIGVRFTGM